MPDIGDMELLRKYALGDSQEAFAEIVHRHINMVYSVALRYVGNPTDAQDITQAVFIILSRKAAGLGEKTILAGWLYETTRFTAMKSVRTMSRRRNHEQEARMQSTLDEQDTESAWQQIGPFLEEAMTRLSQKERTLLALRFYENKNGAETAAALGIEEWAARKRIQRAVEKLRKFFLKRGVTLSAAVIGSAVAANSVQAAPAGLAVTITAATAKGAVVSSSTLTLIKGALKIMAWTKAKTAAVTGVVLLLAAGTTTVIVKHAGQADAIQQNRVTAAIFKQQCIQRITDGKDWALGYYMYAHDHQGQLPKSLAEVKAGKYVKGLSDTNWEQVSGGILKSFAHPDKTVLLRDKEPLRGPDGAYFKAYAFVDGHSELIRSEDSDFEAREREDGFLTVP